MTPSGSQLLSTVLCSGFFSARYSAAAWTSQGVWVFACWDRMRDLVRYLILSRAPVERERIAHASHYLLCRALACPWGVGARSFVKYFSSILHREIIPSPEPVKVRVRW